MNQNGRKRALTLARILAPEEYVRFQELKINDLGFGYDPFGLEIESAVAVLVQGRVQSLIDEGLRRRRGKVFGFSLKDLLPGKTEPRIPAAPRRQIMEKNGSREDLPVAVF